MINKYSIFSYIVNFPFNTSTKKVVIKEKLQKERAQKEERSPVDNKSIHDILHIRPLDHGQRSQSPKGQMILLN